MGNYNNNDDFKVKGDDGTILGAAISAIDDNGTKRLAVESKGTVSPIPDTHTIHRVVNLRKSDGSKSMKVDGSNTSVQFYFAPAAGEIWYVEKLTVVLLDVGTLDPGEFGATVVITNGVDVGVTIHSIDHLIANMKDNKDLALTFSEDAVQINGAAFFGSDGFMGNLDLKVPLKLEGDTNDSIWCQINDNLTSLDEFEIRLHMWKLLDN